MKVKPFQLVYVDMPSDGAEQGKFTFVGEVVSMPFLSNPVMTVENPTGMHVKVRQVPGMPATMIEVPVSILRTYGTGRPRAHYVHFAKVRDRNPQIRERGGLPHGYAFPVDMLRYDGAAPANFKLEDDEQLGIVAKIEEGHSEFVVATLSDHRVDTRAFHTPRWSSFGWVCEPFRVATYRPGMELDFQTALDFGVVK